MKYLTTIMILLMAFMQPAFAEKGKRGNHDERHDRHMERIIDDLKLSSEQEPAVRQILDEQHAKLRKEMEALHEQMRPKMEALKTETSQRLSTVLNEEQLKTFNEKMDKRHDKMRDRKKRWDKEDGESQE